jgi:hypothetical protein
VVIFISFFLYDWLAEKCYSFFASQQFSVVQEPGESDGDA